MHTISRRQFLALSSATVMASMFPLSLRAQSTLRPLPIPRVIDMTASSEATVNLILRESNHHFGEGLSGTTFGINGTYLGPLIRLKNAQAVNLNVKNLLAESTTLHWHGLHVPGEVDGGPQQMIAPNTTWRPTLEIKQRASFNWYHAHPCGKTAEHVYKGLAGPLIVEDSDSLATDLPHTYGVDDFVIVLQDKMFDDQGKMSYQLTEEMLLEGFAGNTLLVNGVLSGVSAQTPRGWIRLRTLNASNARSIGIALANQAPLWVIASDGGFLSQPVEVAGLAIHAGERYEVLLDGTNTTTLDLLSVLEIEEGPEAEETEPEEDETDFADLMGTGGVGLPSKLLIRFIQDPLLPVASSAHLPQRLIHLPPADTSTALRQRNFVLNMNLGAAPHQLQGTHQQSMGINGKAFDMTRIDEQIKRQEMEVWRFTSEDEVHPMHIHGTSFRILRVNGAPPPEYMQGWKDTVVVDDGGATEVLVSFPHLANHRFPYMYHCHLLEHEDMGMMGQFTVSN